MGNSILELASYVQPLCNQFLADCAAAGMSVTIVDTGRTPEQQAVKLAAGVSWTSYSKHEPQPPEGKSEAFDAAPKALIGTKLWSPHSPLWQQMGDIGKKLGLVWGGDWQHHRDPSHFEYKHPTN